MSNPTVKRTIAKIAAAAVLFAQLAVAAYACPTAESPAAAIAAASTEAMPGCDMYKDDGNRNLCVQHCQAGDQSVQTQPSIAVPALAAVPTLTIVEPAAAQAVPRIALISAWSHHATAPPPLIRFGVLRI